MSISLLSLPKPLPEDLANRSAPGRERRNWQYSTPIATKNEGSCDSHPEGWQPHRIAAELPHPKTKHSASAPSPAAATSEGAVPAPASDAHTIKFAILGLTQLSNSLTLKGVKPCGQSCVITPSKAVATTPQKVESAFWTRASTRETCKHSLDYPCEQSY